MRRNAQVLEAGQGPNFSTRMCSSAAILLSPLGIFVKRTKKVISGRKNNDTSRTSADAVTQLGPEIKQTAAWRSFHTAWLAET